MIEKLENGKIIVHRNERQYRYNSIKEYRNDAPMHEGHTFDDFMRRERQRRPK